MNDLLTFLYANWFALTVVVLVIVYRQKLIWEPLSSSDGYISMDECAKAIILVFFGWGVWREGTRADLDKRVFDDTFFLIMVSAVFAIANIRVDISQIMSKKQTSTESKSEVKTTTEVKE